MAITYTPAALPMGAVTIHRALSAVSELAAAVRRWNDTRRTITALNRLSADRLDDIGLTRGDIAKFARRGF